MFQRTGEFLFHYMVTTAKQHRKNVTKNFDTIIVANGL